MSATITDVTFVSNFYDTDVVITRDQAVFGFLALELVIEAGGDVDKVGIKVNKKEEDYVPEDDGTKVIALAEYMLDMSI